jgi:hypothetical protein
MQGTANQVDALIRRSEVGRWDVESRIVDPG